MTDFYVGQYGTADAMLTIGVGEDISANTNEIVFDKPCGSTVTKTATVGLVDVEIDGQLLLAGQYVQYTFVEDDLDREGNWGVKVLTYPPGGGVNPSSRTLMTVGS